MVSQTKQSPNGIAGQQAATNPNQGEASMEPLQDLGCYLKQYAREQPEMAALWCMGIGFVLGWKLRGW